jgi:Lrp/AsnC family leucine-responsive transcriptional regulator
MSGVMPSNQRNSGLDAVDRSLVAELQEDARLSLAELGGRIGL